MNHKFDELAKGLAQSVTRRGALKKFCVGFAGLALASLGMSNKASALGKGIKLCNHCEWPWGCAVNSSGEIIDLDCFNFCAPKCTR